MKLGIILWNLLFSKVNLKSLSTILPSQRETKFSTVFGTYLPNMLILISPASLPPISILKVTVWLGSN
jgi:hypothetical protein